MKRVVPLPSFERAAKKLERQRKELLAKSLEAFNSFLVSGQSPPGFRFKKINHDKYEFRVDIRLRVIVKEEADTFYLVVVGNHDEVRRYLREYR